MIKYNVENINEYSDPTKQETEMYPYEYLSIAKYKEVYNFVIGNVYYGIINKQFTAFKVLSITIFSNYEKYLKDVYKIELPNGEILNTQFGCEKIFFDKQSVKNYIRFNNQEGIMHRSTIEYFFSEELTKGIFAIAKDDSSVYSENHYLIIPHLYYLDKEMQPKAHKHTSFYFICKDKDGLHYAASDKTAHEDNQLYVSYEECDKERRMLHDFNGDEKIQDVELKEGEIYSLTTKDLQTLLFLKDNNMDAKTSCKCYCYDFDIYEEDNEFFGLSTSNRIIICDDEEIDFISEASDQNKKKFKEFLFKTIQEKEKDAFENAEFIKYLKTLL